jgi:hypothetical protein
VVTAILKFIDESINITVEPVRELGDDTAKEKGIKPSIVSKTKKNYSPYIISDKLLAVKLTLNLITNLFFT